MTRTPQSLIALLTLSLAAPLCAVAQDRVVLQPLTLTASPGADDPSRSNLDALTKAVSEAVIALDANGSRTSESISDSTVKLTLAELPDNSQLTVLCNNGGDRLHTFAQALADTLSLDGKVVTTSCTGVGHASDPFKIELNMHAEEGRDARNQLSPVLLTPMLVNPDDIGSQFIAIDGPTADEAAPEPRNDPRNDQPLTLNNRHTQTSHSVMAIPPHWTVPNPPKPIHIDSAYASFDLTITFADGKVVADQQLVIKKDKIDPVERPAFEKWIQTSWSPMAPAIGLESSMGYPESAFSGATDAEKKAANLINQAYYQIQAKNLDQAQASLKQAQDLDPQHEILRENFGHLAAARGDYQTALNDFEEELRAFPTVFTEMEQIASAQEKLGRTDDAIATLQRWTAADPDNYYPPLQLMYVYHNMGRDDLAAAVGDQAMNTLGPDGKRSVQFLLMYGQEQMLAGQAPNAKAAFDSLLNYTTDIQLVNDAAYFLSEQGASLDRAEAMLRAALTQFEPGGQRQHMYNMNPKASTTLLFESWDTLGWILFREGKTKEAELYIRAAWRGHQDPAIGRHLGEILLAQEKPVDALDAYKLALACIPEKEREKKAKDPDVIALHDSIAELEKKGHTSTIVDPAAALARLSVLDAGLSEDFHAKASLNLELSAEQASANPVNVRSQEEFDRMQPALAIVRAMKVPPDFFPPGSKAEMYLDGTLDCTKTCTLSINP